MNKQELLQISFAIGRLANAQALQTQASIVTEQLKAGIISRNEAEFQFHQIYNQLETIKL